MIRNAFRSLSRRIMRHELVGHDANGNEYLRARIMKGDGSEAERRWVQFPSALGHHFYDALSLPPEWHQVRSIMRQHSLSVQ